MSYKELRQIGVVAGHRRGRVRTRDGRQWRHVGHGIWMTEEQIRAGWPRFLRWLLTGKTTDLNGRCDILAAE